MARAPRTPKGPKQVGTLNHPENQLNIPTAQLVETGEVEIGDAQLVWRSKDRQDWSDLIVTAPPRRRLCQKSGPWAGSALP